LAFVSVENGLAAPFFRSPPARRFGTRSIKERAQPGDGLADLPRVAREAEPEKPFAHRPEGAAGRESRSSAIAAPSLGRPAL